MLYEAFGPLLPEFLGGSADLAPSNLTLWSGSKAINEDAAGNYIHYGVREFGMTQLLTVSPCTVVSCRTPPPS